MKITASNLLSRSTVELRPDGIAWTETSAAGGAKFFRFDQISAVLRSPQLLSFQVGTDTYSIPIDLTSPDHRTFAARLASEAKRTVVRKTD